MCACISSNSFNIPNLFITTPVINLGALNKHTCLQPDGLSIHSIASHFITIILHLESQPCLWLLYSNYVPQEHVFLFWKVLLSFKVAQTLWYFSQVLATQPTMIHWETLHVKCYATYTSPQPGVTCKVIFKTLKSTTVKKLNHRMARQIQHVPALDFLACLCLPTASSFNSCIVLIQIQAGHDWLQCHTPYTTALCKLKACLNILNALSQISL